jgi:hypothetical protein
MSVARRILIIGGIALALWGMAYGLWYAVFAEHQALDAIGGSLTSTFVNAADRQPERAHASLAEYRAAKYVYDRQVDVHGHWIGLGMLLIVLGIGLDSVVLSERIKSLLAVAAFLGAVLFPLGVLLQTVDHGDMPRAVAIVGSGLMIASLAAFAFGFSRARSASQ